jgi:hypothetical protein
MSGFYENMLSVVSKGALVLMVPNLRESLCVQG